LTAQAGILGEEAFEPTKLSFEMSTMLRWAGRGDLWGCSPRTGA